MDRRTTTNLSHMSNRKRRLRGTPVKALNLTVDPDAKAKIDLIADALGLSEGIVFDLIMEQIAVDEDGRPDFWTGPLAADLESDAHSEQGHLIERGDLLAS